MCCVWRVSWQVLVSRSASQLLTGYAWSLTFASSQVLVPQAAIAHQDISTTGPKLFTYVRSDTQNPTPTCSTAIRGTLNGSGGRPTRTEQARLPKLFCSCSSFPVLSRPSSRPGSSRDFYDARLNYSTTLFPCYLMVFNASVEAHLITNVSDALSKYVPCYFT